MIVSSLVVILRGKFPCASPLSTAVPSSSSGTQVAALGVDVGFAQLRNQTADRSKKYTRA
jgi:hypothetical protein